MLSVKRFREVMKEEKLSDEEIEKVIQQMYGMAEIMVNDYLSKGHCTEGLTKRGSKR